MADLGLPRGWRQPKRKVHNQKTKFCKLLAKNCIKWQKLDQGRDVNSEDAVEWNEIDLARFLTESFYSSVLQRKYSGSSWLAGAGWMDWTWSGSLLELQHSWWSNTDGANSTGGLWCSYRWKGKYVSLVAIMWIKTWHVTCSKSWPHTGPLDCHKFYVRQRHQTCSHLYGCVRYCYAVIMHNKIQEHRIVNTDKQYNRLYSICCTISCSKIMLL